MFVVGQLAQTGRYSVCYDKNVLLLAIISYHSCHSLFFSESGAVLRIFAAAAVRLVPIPCPVWLDEL